MARLQTRDHIIAWLDKYCPRKAIVRAIREGKTELLGGFSAIPPSGRPGWIVRVTSVHDKIWNVVVIPKRAGKDYEIRVAKDIPWANWIGCHGPYLNVAGKLYHGDKPHVYDKLRERALRDGNPINDL